jgi:hypothetical protein
MLHQILLFLQMFLLSIINTASAVLQYLYSSSWFFGLLIVSFFLGMIGSFCVFLLVIRITGSTIAEVLKDKEGQGCSTLYSESI